MAKIIRVWDGTQWQVVGTALPDALTVDGTQTLTNKSIALGSNTITGTTAQFNTALTDGNFATLAGSETLTNKTISGTDNTLSNIPNNALSNSSITINGSAVSLGGSTTINALPSQTSNSGKYLTTDGSSASWANVTNLVPTDSNISVPGAPTSVTAVKGNAQATVSFSVPSDNGGSTILGYTIISNPGNIKKSTTLTSDTITGLTNGTSYTFTVKAHNIAGTSIASSASSPVTPDASILVNYLVVAGGGGAGRGAGGGGGGGGYRTANNAEFSQGVQYTITVGGGGAAGTSGSVSTNGENSSISGSGFSTFTSTGGGRGYNYVSNYYNANSGGSGGGGGGDTSSSATPGTGNAGGYTPVEGYAGGNGQQVNQFAGGGGGGASAVGQSAYGTHHGGAGGQGISNSITGSSQVYGSGGGGGGGYSGGSEPGGTGGTNAGNGGSATGGFNTPPTSAAANRGGGGGGASEGYGGSNGTAGGSGIVVISAPQAAVSTTGSPSNPSLGLYIFNSSGSITF